MHLASAMSFAYSVPYLLFQEPSGFCVAPYALNLNCTAATSPLPSATPGPPNDKLQHSGTHMSAIAAPLHCVKQEPQHAWTLFMQDLWCLLVKLWEAGVHAGQGPADAAYAFRSNAGSGLTRGAVSRM